MNKRGQIYLIAAIIICMIAFVLVIKSNYIREQVLLQNFKDISSNYLTESPKVVNEVLEENSISDECMSDQSPKLCEINKELSIFTGEFVDNYAHNQDPNVGLIYIYNDKNGVVIQNSLNGENVQVFGELSGDINVLLPTTESLTGKITFGDTGLGMETESNLCKDYENKDYCILKEETLGSDVTLMIGGIKYNFKINPDTPELIVILKSQDQNTVKVDVSENRL